MIQYNMLEIYMATKESDLNFEEQLSLLYSNPEQIDKSLEANLKSISIIIVSQLILKIIRR